MTRRLILTLVCLGMTAAPGAAQSPSNPPSATSPPPAGCTPQSTVTPPGHTGPGATTGSSQEPLGDKLAKSDGVLCPPAGIDPEIRAPTPDTGRTPVIPPPGSPGGDPGVRPK